MTLEHRLRVLLFLIIAVLVGVSQNYIYLSNGFRATDDHVYSYLIGVGIVKSQEVQAAQEFFVNHFDASNSTEEFRYRLELRKKYANNYIFHSSFQYLAGHYLNKGFGIGLSSYPAYLAYAMVAGAVYAYLVALFILVAGLRLMRVSVRAGAAFCLTLVAIALADMLPIRMRLDSIMLHSTLIESIRHSFDLVVRPNPQYSLMSFTERANFFLVAFLVFIARSEGRYSLGYWMVVLLSLFHQSLAGLLLVTLVLLDALLRFPVLKSSKALVPIVIAALAFVSRETLWKTIGTAGLLGVLGVSAMGIAIYLAARLSVRAKAVIFGWAEGGRRIRDRYVLRTGTYADAWLVVLGWAITWPVAFVIVKAINHFSVYYFWAGVHGRTLVLISPYLLYCLLHYLYGLAQKKWAASEGLIANIALALALIGAVPVVYKGIAYYSRHGVIQHVAYTLALVDKGLGKAKIYGGNSESDEILIYYGIAKSVDTGTDLYRQIVPARR